MTRPTTASPNAKPSSVAFFVPGVPGPQGSKRHVGGGRLVESSKKVKPWREAVAAEADAEGVRFYGAVSVGVHFIFNRPRGHYRTGRNAHLLRDDAPTFPVSRAHGDLDKLVRSTLDGLVAGGLLSEDDYVVNLNASKSYGDPHESGATIVVSQTLIGGGA